MEVVWSECLRMAKECSIAYLDHVTKVHTASIDFEDLLTVHERYNPTLYVCCPDKLILANAFDKHMRAFGKPNRIYRVNTGSKPLATGYPEDEDSYLGLGPNPHGMEIAYKNDIKKANYKRIIKESLY